MSAEIDQGEHPLRGICWTLTGVLFASVLLSMPKLAGGDLSTFQIVFIRYIAAAVFFTPVYLWRGFGPVKSRAKQPDNPVKIWFHMLRGLMATFRICCFVYAVTHMPFANAQTVSMSNGVFMMVFAVLILHEHVRISTWIGALVCLTGAVIAAEPSADLTLYLSPAALAALAGAVLWGLESVMIKYVSVRDRYDRILAIVNLTGTFLMLPAALITWVPMTPAQWAFLLAMGPLAVVTQISNLNGFRLAHASLLAPPRYMAIVYALLIGVFVFAEWPSNQALIGMALVVAGGLAVTLRASRG